MYQRITPLKRATLLGILALLAAILAPSLNAQSAFPDWHAHLYTERRANGGINGELLRVSNNGAISRFAVPEAFYPAGYADGNVILADLVISPDLRYLAGSFFPINTDSALPVVIADLQNKACCYTFSAENASAYELGGFEPGSGRLSLSYVGYRGDAAPLPFGAVAVLTPETGEITAFMDSETLANRLGVEYAPWALLSDWVSVNGESVIRLHANCYGCEGAFEGEWSLWNPDSDTMTINSGTSFSIFGDVLPTTNEMLYLEQVASLPIVQMEAMFPPPNAVVYFQDGVLPPYDQQPFAPVVYFDPNLPDLSGRVNWARDGQAYVVSPTNSDTWTIIFRDGTQLPIPGMAGGRFLAGTPEGFLAALPDNSTSETRLINFVAEIAGVFGSPIDSSTYSSEFASSPGYRLLTAPEFTPSNEIALLPLTPLTIVSQPPLPAATEFVETVPTADTLPPRQPSSTPFSFTGPDFITPTAQPIVCSGFTPRLAIGMQGVVTPGTPNNLRSEPLTTAPVLAQIPGGAIFLVIGGPFCDPAGIVWLQVNYNNIIGWTAEGQGGSYYVEPIAQG